MKSKNSYNFLKGEKINSKYDLYIFLGLFFILVFIYFFWFAGYVLYFQEQQSLFIFSDSFIHDFLVKPGGLLDLTGKFLTQFYISNFAGSLILASILTFPAYILFMTAKRIKPDRILTIIPAFIPSFLLFLMQKHYYHQMAYNLGYLFVLLWFYIIISVKKKKFRYVLLFLYPVFYYLTGAYAFIFLALFIVYSLIIERGADRFLIPAILLVLAFVSFLVSKEILFLQPSSELIRYPLPVVNDPAHKDFMVILVVYIIIFPLLVRLSGKKSIKRSRLRTLELVTGLALFSVTIFYLISRFNTQTSRVINIEKLAFSEKWKDLISYQEKNPSENLIGQFFYNVALSETDQLCDRLFYGRQDFGTGSLILEWNSEHLNWGSFSFYTTGLINEAQRWAYEEMVVYGIRPQNIKMLIRTSLLNGNYRMTREYTGLLGKTLFYRSWARKYEKMADDTSLIRTDPELGEKLRIMPKVNFFIYLESPESNLPSLVDGNPENKRAFEYMMSWLMLQKNVDILVTNIRLMKGMGYTRIPRHIEEAIMIYFNSTRNLPDMGGLTISNETLTRFDQYFTTYMAARQNPSTLRQKMQAGFSNTFWFYYHFK